MKRYLLFFLILTVILVVLEIIREGFVMERVLLQVGVGLVSTIVFFVFDRRRG